MTPEALHHRQQVLLIRSTEVRLQLRHDLQRLQRPAQLADQFRAGGNWLITHPQWPLATLLLLVALKPRRVLSWSGKLWWLWRATRQLQRLRAALPRPSALR